MDDTGRCPGCGANLTAYGSPCPHCHGISEAPAIPPSDALQAGWPHARPTFEDDPRLTRGILRPPQGHGLAWTVCLFLCLKTLADALNAIVECDKAQAIFNLLQRGPMAARFPLLHERASLIHFLSIGMTLASALVILYWLYFAYNNLYVLRVGDLTYTPFRAVTSCLIPWSVFYVPARVVQEIWQASDPDLPADSGAWKQQTRSKLIRAWWTLFMIGWVRISINVTPFPFNNRGLLTTILTASMINAVSSLMGALASLLFCAIVLRIQSRQWQRFERVQEMGG